MPNPIRSALLYLKRTKQFRLDCKYLFISTGQNKKEVFKNTISCLHEIIKAAYQSSEGEDSFPRYQAHEVMGVAFTLPFKRNFCVSSHTPLSVYLRDITHVLLLLGSTCSCPDDSLAMVRRISICQSQMTRYARVLCKCVSFFLFAKFPSEAVLTRSPAD